MASILVIEPEEPVLRLIGWTLIDAGHEVVTTQDVESAVTLAKRHQPDVMILNGPVTELTDCISRLRDLLPRAKVIDLRDCDAAADERLLADAVIEKPFPAIDLLETIDELLSDEQTSS